MAKNLTWNFNNRKSELLQINEKILEEIIERALKYNKNHFNVDQKDVIEILLYVRKKYNVFELLDSQRKIILAKKFINSNN